MKKIFGHIFVLMSVLVYASCSDEIKTCEGRVKEVNDSVLVMKISDYEVSFDTRDMRYANGFVIAHDSVVIQYVGSLRSKKVKGLLVRVIPNKGKVVTVGADADKKLETRPFESDSARAAQEKNLNKLINSSDKFGH